MIALKEREFKKIAEFVKVNYGVDLREKKILIEGRLQSTLGQKGFTSFSEYFEYIVTDTTGKAVAELISKITTNYTFFMREEQHFDYLKSKILPYLLEKYDKEKDLRIWSAGCSSGEEPYTIAMVIADYFGSDKGYWNSKILATDISTNVLDKAISGIYINEQIEVLSKYWKVNYFEKIDKEKSKIADKIKEEVIFRRFNLMSEVFPFKRKFHIIFCRNVMIYFDLNTKKELVEKFYELTEPGGYLFISHSESLNFEGNRYKYVMPSIYRKE